MTAGLIGFAVWCVAHALFSLVVWVIVAVPFGLLLVFDTLAGEHATTPTLTLVWSDGETQR